jgi:hypothetical protein
MGSLAFAREGLPQRQQLQQLPRTRYDGECGWELCPRMPAGVE